MFAFYRNGGTPCCHFRFETGPASQLSHKGALRCPSETSARSEIWEFDFWCKVDRSSCCGCSGNGPRRVF